MSEASVDVVERYVRAYNDKDLDAIEAIWADPFSFEGTEMARDDFLAIVQSYWDAFPDMTLESTHLIADDGGYVLSRDVLTATGRGEYYGHDVDGTSIETTEMTLFHVDDGTIDEYWFEWGALEFWQQLGVIEDPYR